MDGLTLTGPDVILLPQLHQLLHLFPHLPGDDGRQVVFVTVLLLGIGETEGLVDLVPLALVADQGAGVGFVLQDPADHGAVPKVFLLDLLLQPLRHPLAQQLPLHSGRRFSFLLVEHSGDSLQSHTAHIGCKNQVDRLGSFGNNFYTVGILILEVTEGRRDDDACFLLLSIASGHTAAAVSGIEVVHQSLEANDQIVCFVECIDVLRGGQHPDMILPQVIDEEGGLGTVTAQTGQVFDDDGIDAPGIHRFAQLGDALPFEVHAGDVVIEGLAHDGVAVTESIAFDDAALVHQGVQFFIFVTGQAVVKPYSHVTSPFRAGCVLQHTP